MQITDSMTLNYLIKLLNRPQLFEDFKEKVKTEVLDYLLELLVEKTCDGKTFERLGNGASRITFAINKDLVLKIEKDVYRLVKWKEASVKVAAKSKQGEHNDVNYQTAFEINFFNEESPEYAANIVAYNSDMTIEICERCDVDRLLYGIFFGEDWYDDEDTYCSLSPEEVGKTLAKNGYNYTPSQISRVLEMAQEIKDSYSDIHEDNIGFSECGYPVVIDFGM